jgi:hypothetical protein
MFNIYNNSYVPTSMSCQWYNFQCLSHVPWSRVMNKWKEASFVFMKHFRHSKHVSSMFTWPLKLCISRLRCFLKKSYRISPWNETLYVHVTMGTDWYLHSVAEFRIKMWLRRGRWDDRVGTAYVCWNFHMLLPFPSIKGWKKMGIGWCYGGQSFSRHQREEKKLFPTGCSEAQYTQHPSI